MSAHRERDPEESTAGRCTVGVFDSGIGGLTVVAALHRLAPALPIRYIADTAYFPYGDRPHEVVAERARLIARQLVDEGCRLIVVACNTASSASLEALRAELSVEAEGVPVVGMEPPLKPAVERSRNGRVAVLVTEATAGGERLARLHRAHAGDSNVVTIALPGLADLVEHGELAGPRLDELLAGPLADIREAGVDAVALGCTHYGFLRETIAGALGPSVEVLDAAEPVARRVLHQLEEHGIPVAEGDAVAVACSATGDPEAFGAAIEELRVAHARLPPLRVVHGAAA